MWKEQCAFTRLGLPVRRFKIVTHYAEPQYRLIYIYDSLLVLTSTSFFFFFHSPVLSVRVKKKQGWRVAQLT